MPEIIFTLPDSSVVHVDGKAGDSLMETAFHRNLPGIEGQCGGFCNCATCHVYIDEAWVDRLPAAEEEELELLDGTVAPRRPTSRLSCQIRLSEALDGLRVAMPDRQS
jgi:2Fe-2S ferredoxin